MPERKALLVRVDPAVHEALAHWAADELRSTAGQVELILRRALADAGRLPATVGAMPKRGRPPKEPEATRRDDPAMPELPAPGAREG